MKKHFTTNIWFMLGGFIQAQIASHPGLPWFIVDGLWFAGMIALYVKLETENEDMGYKLRAHNLFAEMREQYNNVGAPMESARPVVMPKMPERFTVN